MKSLCRVLLILAFILSYAKCWSQVEPVMLDDLLFVIEDASISRPEVQQAMQDFYERHQIRLSITLLSDEDPYQDFVNTQQSKWLQQTAPGLAITSWHDQDSKAYQRFSVQVNEALKAQLPAATAEEVMQPMMSYYGSQMIPNDAITVALTAALKVLSEHLDAAPPPEEVPPITFVNGNGIGTTPASGFDQFTYEALRNHYETIRVKGEDYPVAWKALCNGKSESVLAQVDVSLSFPQQLVFKQNGNVLPTQPATEAYQQQLNLLGQGHEQEGSIEVYASGREDAELVGKLNTISYDALPRTLVLIALDGAIEKNKLISLGQEVQKIYAKAGVSITVRQESFSTDWGSSAVALDDDASGLLSNYPSELKHVIKDYRKQHQEENNTAYIFLAGKSKSGKLGFMPKKRNYGFVFVKNHQNEPLEKTIAHELGHGLFRLEHTFEAYSSLTIGSTANLMDYQGQSTHLHKYQWDLIHNPEAMLGWFQDDEENAMTDTEILRTAFADLVGDLMCAYRSGSSTSTWDWPSTEPLFVPGKITLFDGKEYSISSVKKLKRFEHGTFSEQPTETEVGNAVELRFYSDQGDWVSITINQADKASFLRLLNGAEFQSNFNNWLAKVKSETSTEVRAELIRYVPKCGLEHVTNLDDRVTMIKLILENITYLDESGEQLVIKLIEATSNEQLKDFHAKLKNEPFEHTNLLNYIFQEMDDIEIFFSDGNNATLIEILTAQKLKQLTDNDIADLRANLQENENLFVWAGKVSGGKGSYNFYRSKLSKEGEIQLTIGNWYPNNLTSNTEDTYLLNPLDDWVVIYTTESIPQIGYEANTPYIAPAIVLHYLISEEDNANTRQAVFTSIDIASFAIGAGAISSGIRGWKLAVAVIETTSAAASISLDAFEQDLKNAGWTDSEINDLRVATMVIELAGVGLIEGPKIVTKLQNAGPRMWKKLDRMSEYAANLKPAVKQRLEALQEFLRRYLDDVVNGGRSIYKNISLEQFCETVTNFKNGTNIDLARQAYELWGNNQWEELYKLFLDHDLNNWKGIIWPPFYGAKRISKVEVSSELSNKIFDRFQESSDLNGGFASPILNSSEGVADLAFTYDSRALANRIKEGTYYIKFKLIGDLPENLIFEYSEVIPWFNLPGFADQIKSSMKLDELVKRGNIEIIEKLKFENGKWVEVQ